MAAQSPITDSSPIAAAQLQERADQLAAILRIRPALYAGHAGEAYQIMGHLAAMPTLKDTGARHRYGNEILGNAGRAFSAYGGDGAAFFARVQGLVIEMQEFPAWFHDLSDSNEMLVENYVTVTSILDGMKYAGLTGFGGAAAKASAGGLAGGVNAATAGGGARAIAGAAVKGGWSATTKMMTGGFVSRASILVWVVGQVAYAGLQDEQSTMQKEIICRYQENRLSAKLYQRALGSDMPRPSQYLRPL